MKKKYYPIIESLLTVFFLALILIALGRLVENKSAYTKYNEFYKYSDEYDVLFCGSSHMMNMALPMELWKNYGIRSYNMGNGAETLPVTYHVIRNALDSSHPKVIVLDAFYAYSDKKVPEISREMPHQFFDAVPLSVHKKEAVFDLFPDAGDRMNYLYDFSIYHSRWNELTWADVHPEDEGMGGARVILDSYVPSDTTFDPPEIHNMAKLAKKYLVKIKELCDSRNVRLICVVNPYAMWQENRLSNIDFEKEMGELGIEFVDLRDAGIVDIFADSADNMHLNLNGQRKVTDYYGKYLTDNVMKDISDPEGDTEGDMEGDKTSDKEIEDRWSSRYDVYVKNKAGFLSSVTECDALLSDLNDPDFFFDITLREGVSLPAGISLMLDNASENENVSIVTDASANADVRVRIRYANNTANNTDARDYFTDMSFTMPD